MLTVKQLLDVKGKSVYTIQKNATTLDALHMLADKGVGALLVVEHDRPVGILSERDIVRRIAEIGVCDLSTPAENLMTSPILYVGLDYTLDECMSLMTHKHIRHLPVMDEGRLVGVISIGDVVKAQIEDRDTLITHLEQYISGTGYGH